MDFSLYREHISAILLDIEGTTTPIAFVYDVLFPFARLRVQDYLEKHFETAAVQEDLSRLRLEHQSDLLQSLDPPPISAESGIVSFVTYIQWLMDRDRKSTGLKGLQGRIWQEGYAAGELKSRVFPDVPPAFADWRVAGLDISIFSSGSVLAQKLLFAHSEAGDLTSFINCYFDTTTGPKIAAESYRFIAAALDREPGQVLFISDVVAELDGARSAGMKTLLCIRPGNHDQAKTHAHPAIRSFAEIAR